MTTNKYMDRKVGAIFGIYNMWTFVSIYILELPYNWNFMLLRNVVAVNIMQLSLFRCILDGEMLVWDTSTNRFAEFGSNQEIGLDGFNTDYYWYLVFYVSLDCRWHSFAAKAAREGLESDRQVRHMYCVQYCIF